MRTRRLWTVSLAVLVAATLGCGSVGSLVSSSASTAVSSVAQTASAPGSSTGGTQSPASDTSGATAGGTVPIPTSTVAYTKGKVYAVGQAVKDEKSGAIFQVNDVKFDSSISGLAAGQTWCLITITIGNTGTSTFSGAPMTNMWIKSSGTGQQYTASLMAIISSHVVPQDSPLGRDVTPGTAVQGVLPIIVPDTATGLVLYGSVQPDQPPFPVFEIGLGK